MAQTASTFPQFEGKDLDGNSVSSSLFSDNAFTVVNFWFSGCKPCVDEMDDLNALNQRIQEQGGEVIGINTETLDGNADNIAAAKQILEQAGAAFRNIYFDSASDAGKFALGIMAFPTTKKRRFNGQIFLGYIIWYGLGRAWIEGLRTDSLLIGNTGLRASQLVAVGSVIVAAALMVIGLRNAKGKPLMVPLAVKDLKKQAEAGDRFTPDTLPAGAPHAEFVRATDAMNARLDALDLSEVEIEEI